MSGAAEIADILTAATPSLLDTPNLPWVVQRAMHDITTCRTAERGGHASVCPRCGHLEVSYNSCRNRSCPKCQSYKREKWVAARESELLDTGYFHLVFTIPESLNPIFYQNQKVCYSLLFSCAWSALRKLADDPKYLGATPGAISVLHTWTQKLDYHPHIHMIVPAGGLADNGRWVASRADWLVPVRALSRLFRAKLIAALRKAVLHVWEPGGDEVDISRIFHAAFEHDWVVYCKPPFAGPIQVLRYLGRYTHKIAISNTRIKAFDGKTVTFSWRDRADGNAEKEMRLPACEFARRFLMHVPPKGFMRIRHYGFLANRDKRKRIARLKRLTNTPIRKMFGRDPLVIIERLIGRRPGVCPDCGIELLPTVLPLVT